MGYHSVVTIVRTIAALRVSTGALARLAPGALLLLAVTGTNAAIAGDTWLLSSPKIPRTETPLTDTIARAVGLNHGAGAHISIIYDGLVHHVRPALTFVTASRPPWTMLFDADEARGEELRFITGGIDPPLASWNHG